VPRTAPKASPLCNKSPDRAPTAVIGAYGRGLRREDPIARAADLAEAILDAVSSAQQDWRLIGQWARELAELAARAAHEPAR
jgi:hypothetical protein